MLTRTYADDRITRAEWERLGYAVREADGLVVCPRCGLPGHGGCTCLGAAAEEVGFDKRQGYTVERWVPAGPWGPAQAVGQEIAPPPDSRMGRHFAALAAEVAAEKDA